MTILGVLWEMQKYLFLYLITIQILIDLYLNILLTHFKFAALFPSLPSFLV